MIGFWSPRGLWLAGAFFAASTLAAAAQQAAQSPPPASPLTGRPDNEAAQKLAPVEYLVGVHAVCSRHPCNGSTRLKRLLDDPPLLLHCAKPPLALSDPHLF